MKHKGKNLPSFCKSVVVNLVFGVPILLWAQAPGGIKKGLSLWLRADTAIYVSDDLPTQIQGGAVGIWKDISGKGGTFYQPSTFLKPKVQKGAPNFVAHIQFDGINDYLLSETRGIRGTHSTTFIVSGRSDGHLNYLLHSSMDGGDMAQSYLRQVAGKYEYGHRVNQKLQFAYHRSKLGSWNLLTKVHHDKWVNLFVNGMEREEGMLNLPFYTNTTAIGARYINGFADYFFDAGIAEIIHYDRVLSNRERYKVESYLALKYGLSLGHDYYVSSKEKEDGHITWEKGQGFDFGIAGIGRDSTFDLHIKQSISMESGSVLSMSKGEFRSENAHNPHAIPNDRSFLMWGHNGGNTRKLDANYSKGLKNGISRIWRIQQKGRVGELRVRIIKNGLANDINTVFVGKKADLTEAEAYSLREEEDFWETEIDFIEPILYMSLGRFEVAPGGIAGKLALWKKDMDATIDDGDLEVLDTFDFASKAYQVYMVHENPHAKNEREVDIVQFAEGELSGEFSNLFAASQESSEIVGVQPRLFDQNNLFQVYAGPELPFDLSSKIKEMIIYSDAYLMGEAPGEAQKRILSYLCMKHGISPRFGAFSLRSSEGTLIWDAFSYQSPYRNGITVIGHDKGSGFEVSSQKSATQDALIQIALDEQTLELTHRSAGQSIENFFQAWAHNGENTAFEAAFSSHHGKRMNRTWMARETGNVGMIKISLPRSVYFPRGSKPSIIISQDDVFDYTDDVFPLLNDGQYFSAFVDLQDSTFFTFAGYVPPLPGGVDDEIALWLKGEKGVHLNNHGEVVLWEDQSGNYRDAWVPGNKGYFSSEIYAPKWLEQGVNGQAALHFSSNPDALQLGSEFITAALPEHNGMSMIVVAEPEQTGSDRFLIDQGFYPYFGMGLTFSQDSIGLYSPQRSGEENNRGPCFSFSGKREGPSIIQGEIALGGTQSLFMNGDLIQDVPAVSLKTLNHETLSLDVLEGKNGYPFTIGRQAKDDVSTVEQSRHFQGKIAEVIVYKKTLNEAERRRINSYLSLKYSIPLFGGHFASDWDGIEGTRIWEEIGEYKFGVKGIGRDDKSSLDKQLVTVDPQRSFFRLALGGFSDNEEDALGDFPVNMSFLIWGHNGRAFSPVLTGEGAFYKLGRSWRFEEHGWVDSVEIRIPNVMGLTHALISMDSSFSTFDTLAFIEKGDELSLSLDIQHGSYVGFGRPNPRYVPLKNITMLAPPKKMIQELHNVRIIDQILLEDIERAPKDQLVIRVTYHDIDKKLILEYPQSLAKHCRLQIIDAEQQKVLNLAPGIAGQFSKLEIPVHDWVPGSYWVKLFDRNRQTEIVVHIQ